MHNNILQTTSDDTHPKHPSSSSLRRRCSPRGPRGTLAALGLGLGVAAASFIATPAQAAVVLSATSVTRIGGFDRQYGPTVAINQSGLLTTYTSGVTSWDTYFSGNPLHRFEVDSGGVGATGYEYWGMGATFTLKFDFGAVVDLSGIALWVEDFQGITKFNLRTDSATLLSNQVPSNNPGAVNYAADRYTFATTSTRYLYLDFLDNPDLVFGSQNFGPSGAVGEVAFRQETGPAPSGVPDGTTTALLVAPLGLGLAWASRRRGQAVRP
jgi:MYXO-CTERM domain-containing protein